MTPRRTDGFFVFFSIKPHYLIVSNRENRRGSEEWRIQRHRQHWVNFTKERKIKQKTEN